MKYYFEKTLNCSFEEAVKRVTEELKKEGFGVLSEINIHEKLKEKFQVDSMNEVFLKLARNIE